MYQDPLKLAFGAELGALTMLSKDPDVTQTETSSGQRVCNFRFPEMYGSYPSFPFVIQNINLTRRVVAVDFRRFLIISGQAQNF